ncbi:MAG TPA: PEP/pyruvate-binding domain-containing protein [Candidatus Eisenbacteria bacterium]|nr:PEP/pyruvate-binding domain-containing protein [Candidatus Eisenbacteria bacterium]
MPHSTGKTVEWLGAAEGDPAALGGKAASLDRLAKLGFRVPPGFCLTTHAFEAQVRAVASQLPVGPDGERFGAERWDGGGLAEALEASPLIDEIAQPLAEAVRRLTGTASPDRAQPTFAVRSSAIGEDGSASSYAGLHETELGVAGADVEVSVRRCWASLWSAPALAYRSRRGLSTDRVAMAVVVQELVPADAAAVAFTRHPVTGRTDQLVITAVRGLGDAMVAGTVTPDTFVIARDSLAVLEYAPGDGTLTPAIDDPAVRALAALCLDVESKFGAAVDVEAAITGGEWYLLQARPITTNAPAAASR